MEAPSKPEPTNTWRGIHHVAVTTSDIDATVGFYVDVLGMTAGEVSSSSRQGAGKNCFVYPDFRNAGGVMGIHFFEDAEVRPGKDHADPWDRSSGAGTVHHLAFAVASGEEASELRGRLEKAGAWTSEVIDFGTSESLLFRDNSGLMLEATWPKP